MLHHAYRIKNYIGTHSVLPKALTLVKSESKHLVCSAIRFLRTCIGLKDEFYIKRILSGHLLDPVIEAFVANGMLRSLCHLLFVLHIPLTSPAPGFQVLAITC